MPEDVDRLHRRRADEQGLREIGILRRRRALRHLRAGLQCAHHLGAVSCRNTLWQIIAAASVNAGAVLALDPRMRIAERILLGSRIVGMCHLPQVSLG